MLGVLPKAVEVSERYEQRGSAAARLRDLGLVLGLQGKILEASSCFDRSIEISQSIGDTGGLAYAFEFKGIVLSRNGQITKAEESLIQSQSIFDQWFDEWTIPLLSNWWGILFEIKRDHESATAKYVQCLRMNNLGQLYWHTFALTGLIRVKHAQGNIASIPPLLAEAEQLAQQYEYNDHLASLRLTQGHLAWETGKIDDAITFYQHAIIYALRYNRFLLDELLSGRPQGTPLRPVISYCLERGEEGKKILLTLRDWWNTGVNDVGTPRPDTISSIPEGIPLLEAEKIAREREPGDGLMQKSVIDQIGTVL
jgi:tetratricopeptide (TPR) repeat protein